MDLNDFIEHNMNTMMRSQPVKQPKWLLSKAHHWIYILYFQYINNQKYNIISNVIVLL